MVGGLGTGSTNGVCGRGGRCAAELFEDGRCEATGFAERRPRISADMYESPAPMVSTTEVFTAGMVREVAGVASRSLMSLWW